MVGTFHNDCRINTVAALDNGTDVLTGDDSGAVKCWDLRTGAWTAMLVAARMPAGSVRELLRAGELGKPVCHVAPAHLRRESPPRCPRITRTGSKRTLLAVNSYDNGWRGGDVAAMMSCSAAGVRGERGGAGRRLHSEPHVPWPHHHALAHPLLLA